MPDPFTLPPAASAITKSITFSAEQRPYVEEWYLATKEATETINDFVTRIFTQKSIAYRRSQLLAQSQSETEVAVAADHAVHDAYAASVDAEVEAVRAAILP